VFENLDSNEASSNCTRNYEDAYLSGDSERENVAVVSPDFSA
jgi:hypothetical protein